MDPGQVVQQTLTGPGTMNLQGPCNQDCYSSSFLSWANLMSVDMAALFFPLRTSSLGMSPKPYMANEF